MKKTININAENEFLLQAKHIWLFVCHTYHSEYVNVYPSVPSQVND